MIDIKCSREGTKCTDCPIKRDCDFIEVTEDVDPYAFYEKGRADKEEELQGLKDLGALYSEIRADERAKVIEELTELFLGIRPNKITEYKCIDGVVRNRPLVDVAIILEKLEQLKEQNNE